jgi:hypothetical protein
MPAPDFLVIGAQKCGTTWLYSCLRKHPGCYLPPKKELHYFDRSSFYPSSNKLSVKSPFNRLLNLSLFKNVKKDVSRITSPGRLKWYLKFHLGVYNDDWYKSLFNAKSEFQVSGEVTPAYSMLEKEDIQKVHLMNPDMKIIFIMRNPIERDWSAFKMRVRKHNLNFEMVKDKYVYNFFDLFSSKGDYLSTIKNWKSIFPTEQLFWGYYDDIERDPKNFLQRVFDFLCLDTFEDWDKLPLNKKINKGLNIPIKKKYEIYLSQKYCSDLKEIFGLTGSAYVKSWYEQTLHNLYLVNK